MTKLRRVLLAVIVGTVASGGALRAQEPSEVDVFMVPRGDAAQGRETFLQLKCNACHQVETDAGVPAPWSANPGPVLRSHGSTKRVGYLIESIVTPSHRVGPDVFPGLEGVSSMGDYSHVMTVRQLLDLVAYLDAQS